MEIKFDFSNEIYAEKLIKRLLETTSGLSVADALSEDYDVLLTDRYQHVADERTVYLSDLLTDPVSIYSSTDAIRDYAVSVYEKNSGKLFRTVKRKKRTVSFYSEFGGSGCTSVALTYSRCLALNGKKTVFITKGNSYIPEEKKRRAKSLKLNYRLHSGKGESITSFMEEDMYGLYVIYVADFSQIEKLAASIGSLNEFDWIVIDYGTVRPVTG
ncbi:MAG: hypothetical protein MJ171_07120, partial [Clostridia bacterium]|nr:hypothetical protein [Clostridia bacterium]